MDQFSVTWFLALSTPGSHLQLGEAHCFDIASKFPPNRLYPRSRVVSAFESTDCIARHKMAAEIRPQGWDGLSTWPHRELQNDLWASEKPLSHLTPWDVFFLCQAAVSSSSPPPSCPHSTSTIANRHTNITGTHPTTPPPNANTHTHTHTHTQLTNRGYCDDGHQSKRVKIEAGHHVKPRTHNSSMHQPVSVYVYVCEQLSSP